MAEKEERILIDILPPASGFGSCGGFYTEGVGEYFGCWNGEKEPITEEICNNCPYDKSMTRQETIDRIAKALHKESTRISNMEKDFDKLPADWRKSFYNYAEAALNALLGEK